MLYLATYVIMCIFVISFASIRAVEYTVRVGIITNSIFTLWIVLLFIDLYWFKCEIVTDHVCS